MSRDIQFQHTCIGTVHLRVIQRKLTDGSSENVEQSFKTKYNVLKIVHCFILSPVF